MGGNFSRRGATRLGDSLDQSETLGALHEHAQRLARLQSVCESLLPQFIGGGCYVANLKKDVLILQADNAALAARVRQSLPSLTAGLARQGFLVSEIRLKVRPLEKLHEAAPAVPVRHIGRAGQQALDTLVHALPQESSLRNALDRLLRSQSGGR